MPLTLWYSAEPDNPLYKRAQVWAAKQACLVQEQAAERLREQRKRKRADVLSGRAQKTGRFCKVFVCHAANGQFAARK